MKQSVKDYDVTVTIEEVAKARHFGDSDTAGILFILEKGLTNLSRGRRPASSFLRSGFNKPQEAL